MFHGNFVYRRRAHFGAAPGGRVSKIGKHRHNLSDAKNKAGGLNLRGYSRRKKEFRERSRGRNAQAYNDLCDSFVNNAFIYELVQDTLEAADLVVGISKRY
jgi:hypothetical protein